MRLNPRVIAATNTHIVVEMAAPMGGTNTMTLPTTIERLGAWRTSGALIQDALPELDDGEREFLMSGITPAMWAAIFPSD